MGEAQRRAGGEEVDAERLSPGPTAGREGVRMGLWGASQAIAFAIGGILATGAVDLAKLVFGSPLVAYSLVFAAEGALFVLAARLAARIGPATESRTAPYVPVARGGYAAPLQRE